MSNPPLTLRRMALHNLRRKPFRTWCLAFIVALFAFTLFGGGVLRANLDDGLKAFSDRLGADILLVPYGYEKKLQAALLRGEPSEFYIKAELIDKIRQAPGVAKATPQLFLASLDSECCTVKVQLVGFDQKTDFTVLPWIQKALKRPLGNHEVVVGSLIMDDVGEEIHFFGKNFTVAAKMERTGMGFDSSVFMPLDAARELMQEGGIVTGDAAAMKDYVSSILIKVNEGANPKDVANSLMPTYAMGYNLDMVLATGMISDIAAGLKNIGVVIYGLAGLFWLLAVGTLFMVFSAGLNERKRELSLLRILGAPRAKLAALLLTESLFISITGAVMGIALAAAVVFPFSTLIFASLGLPFLPLSLPEILTHVLTAVITAFAVGPLACLWSALSITRFDIYETLREGE